MLGLNTTCSVCCGAHLLYLPLELRLSFLRLPGALVAKNTQPNFCPENYPCERQASHPRLYCLLSDSSHPMAGQYSDMKMRFSSLHLSYPEWPCQLENGTWHQPRKASVASEFRFSFLCFQFCFPHSFTDVILELFACRYPPQNLFLRKSNLDSWYHEWSEEKDPKPDLVLDYQLDSWH